MRRLLLAMPLLAACASAPRTDDPYLWLEDIEGERALAWVRQRNDKSLRALTGDARYAGVEGEVREILLAKDRIPMPSLNGGWVWNFWQDPQRVRGVWRRARPAEYATAEPAWETVIDLDALARAENENWVWKGAQPLPPECERWLVTLSRGGKDASVVREFDVTSRAFVKDGFTLPEAKSRVAWKDRDAVFVGTDFGPGTLTSSGYPRTVRLWKRGTPPAEAPVVFEGRVDDVAVSATTMFRPEGSTTFVSRRFNFFEGEVHRLGPDGPRRVPFPTTADVEAVFQGQVLASLRTPWRAFPAGSIVSMPLDRLDEEAAALVRAPGDRSTITGVSATRDAIYLQLLENVRPRLLPIRKEGEAWTAGAGVDASIVSADPFESFVYVRREDFLTPTSVWREPPGDGGALKRLPEKFDAAGLEWKQLEAASADGTRVPYFLVSRKGLPQDGTTPTLLYGYGGFEISMTPQYLGTLGKVWLERGGAYVLANIRGGGEFGPRWHQAALRENRPRAFEDFVAVAEDLVRRNVTSPRRLGIMGGSNGGLLVGAAFTRRPDLFRAVVCEVPLLDMMRYHKLLAGASWRAEYGDPDDPAAAASIRAWSPYQNLRADAPYPKVFFVTSTKDDRVHPGHARKAVARMEELGHEVLYFENVEGGHGAAANLEQRVKKSTLEYVYLLQQLVD